MSEQVELEDVDVDLLAPEGPGNTIAVHRDPEEQTIQVEPITKDKSESKSESKMQAQVAGASNLSTAMSSKRQRFTSKTTFYFSLIGFAVGIGNVWRFAYVAYANGGGAFLLPYLICTFLVGLPLVALELTLGQVLQMDAPDALAAIHPRLRGIGVASLVLVFCVVAYYNILLAWSAVFMVVSFVSPLPYNEDKYPDVARYLNVLLDQKDHDLSDLGQPVYYVLIALFICWLLVFLIIRKGVKNSGKIAIATVSIPYLILVVLFFRAITLDGASRGISYYVTPQWDTLADPGVWTAALVQVLYSLSPGWSIIITFGSFLDVTESTVRPATIVCTVNSLTSMFSGLIVFSTLGYLAKSQGVEVEDVASSGPELAFVVYPAALRLFPAAQVFAVLFFATLLLLGIDSVFASVETLSSAAYPTLKQWCQSITPMYVSMGICILLFSIGISLTTGGGMALLELCDRYIPMHTLFLTCMIESLAVGWLYSEQLLEGTRTLRGEHGEKMSPHWITIWRYIVPAALIVAIIAQITNEINHPPDSSAGTRAVGIALSLLCPCVMLYYAIRTPPEDHYYMAAKKPAEIIDEMPDKPPDWKRQGTNVKGSIWCMNVDTGA